MGNPGIGLGWEVATSSITEGSGDLFGVGIQLALGRRGADSYGKAEPVPSEARQHMQVTVEDRLASRGPIGEEQVHPFTAQAGPAQRFAQELPESEHVLGVFARDIGQPSGVFIWDDKAMPWVDGMDIHESGHLLVLIDDASIGLAARDAAEYAAI
jgi:hypothetical protein